MHVSRVAATILLLLMGGCGVDSPQPGNESTNPVIVDTPVASVAPDPRSTPIVTRAIPTSPLYDAGDIDPGLRPFIDQAKADLAELLGVDAADIATHAAVLVVWPDASLGCSLPDMRYAQVPTDGSVIELAHDGVTYRYHTGGRRGPFQCATPLAKAPGGEGRTRS